MALNLIRLIVSATPCTRAVYQYKSARASAERQQFKGGHAVVCTVNTIMLVPSYTIRIFDILLTVYHYVSQ
jgi:hypothetical protein